MKYLAFIFLAATICDAADAVAPEADPDVEHMITFEKPAKPHDTWTLLFECLGQKMSVCDETIERVAKALIAKDGGKLCLTIGRKTECIAVVARLSVPAQLTTESPTTGGLILQADTPQYWYR